MESVNTCIYFEKIVKDFTLMTQVCETLTSKHQILPSTLRLINHGLNFKELKINRKKKVFPCKWLLYSVIALVFFVFK